MAKEYGKLTADQFSGFIQKLPELRHHGDELGALLADLPKAKFDDLMVRGFNWGGLYELSFAEHIGLATVAFGQLSWLLEVGKSPDPQQQMLDDWSREVQDPETHPDFTEQDLLALAYSLQRTILSVMLFQRSLSGLVKEVRDDDNMDSLFNAVRVDRTVLSCPTIADKIARAEMRQDKRFFHRLRNALRGPTQKHWAAYCDLRYSLFVLRELGFDKMSDAQLEQLLVHKLKVYPDTPSARKNLRAQYQQSRKIKTS